MDAHPFTLMQAQAAVAGVACVFPVEAAEDDDDDDWKVIASSRLTRVELLQYERGRLKDRVAELEAEVDRLKADEPILLEKAPTGGEDLSDLKAMLLRIQATAEKPVSGSYTGATITRDQLRSATRVGPVKYRTKADVDELQKTVRGCCAKNAVCNPCVCLEEARNCYRCGDSGYEVHPENGWKVGVRCQNRCPVKCDVCGNPNCDNPNGQH